MKTLKSAFAVVAATALWGGPAMVIHASASSEFPGKPIKIVVISTPGGVMDDTARRLADHFSKAWGQPVIVENRPGANGSIAATTVANAPADGHTLLYATRAIAMNAALYKLPFNTAALVPVAMTLKQPNLLVVSKHFPTRDVPALLKLIKQNPGKYSYGSTGGGSVPHVAGELFQKITGTRLIHVPYKGGAPLKTDLHAGRIDMTFTSVGTTMANIRDGTLLPVALASSERSPMLPQVPTFAEFGVKDFNVDGWYGLFAPAGTPAATVKKVNDEANKYLATEEAAKSFEFHGVIPFVSSPERFKQDFQNDLAMYRKLVGDLKLKID